MFSKERRDACERDSYVLVTDDYMARKHILSTLDCLPCSSLVRVEMNDKVELEQNVTHCGAIIFSVRTKNIMDCKTLLVKTFLWKMTLLRLAAFLKLLLMTMLAPRMMRSSSQHHG